MGLVGKRGSAREILETAHTRADIETAGLLGVGTKIYDDADWERYFQTVRELDIFFAYGSAWRGLSQARLRRLAPVHARIGVFLPDPGQPSMVAQLPAGSLGRRSRSLGLSRMRIATLRSWRVARRQTSRSCGC